MRSTLKKFGISALAALSLAGATLACSSSAEARYLAATGGAADGVGAARPL